eukprot:5139544-Pleurochrysis_carterae.AAC.4
MLRSCTARSSRVLGSRTSRSSARSSLSSRSRCAGGVGSNPPLCRARRLDGALHATPSTSVHATRWASVDVERQENMPYTSQRCVKLDAGEADS